MSWFIEDTKQQIYFEEVINPYVPQSKLARKLWNNMQPYQIGEEEKWNEEMEQLTILIQMLKRNKFLLQELDQLYSKFNDIQLLLDWIIYQDYSRIDPLIDGFHIKQFLWFSHSLSEIINQNLNDNEKALLVNTNWYKMLQHDWGKWLQRLQPSSTARSYYPDFALQDIDDQRLKELRRRKRELLKKIYHLEKSHKEQVENKYKVTLNSEGYLLLQTTDDRLPRILEDHLFKLLRQQGEEMVFRLVPLELERKIAKDLTDLEQMIEKEEERRFKEFLAQFSVEAKELINAHHQWTKIEVLYKKAQMAIELNGVKPIIKNSTTKEDVRCNILLKNGIHPFIREVWLQKQHDMKPITIELEDKVSVLFGANMSGKTIILRTVGLMVALAQYGFYVPAEEFRFSFISHLSLITGDFQDINMGLSSFGAEIVRISKNLSFGGKVFYLIDEVGRGTNPIEGEAIAIAILRYLRKKAGSYSLFVSHFPNLIQEKGITLYEVKNYQPTKMDGGKMVFEAITVAENLGLPSEVVEDAKNYLHQLRSRED
ncbi:hypothetical protein BHF71_03780 [Vulcanibacillus modesticaldus]|uniref:DNA mismatch repair proteins mutS family domain-containing protein n=1 Tax=Vulcanibacillus modesticaldus TaxID=337097 RepID=A0A1D2YSG4_9BACI|nr:hypothetical protein [Vulcanibacillus modesticaldus]OEF97265.1 hypothetical protein BHF71_03780 [Vulcanibacillus modesticaldus]